MPPPHHPPPPYPPPFAPAPGVPFVTAPAHVSAPDLDQQTLDGSLLGGRSRRIRSHGRRKGRVSKWALLILVLGLIAVGAGLRVLPGSPLASGGAADPGPAASPTPPPLPLRPAQISLDAVQTQGFLSWAILDRRTGEIVGSPNMDQASDTASMIKSWLAADALRRATEAKQTPTTAKLNELEIMIRDSDNNAADRTYNANGKTASIDRMVSVCSLTDSKSVPGLWSNTIMSARDVVRLGQCIADGRAAGPKWTPWLLDMMRNVRGVGDFGIRKAFPAGQQDQIAIKNGWLLRDEDHQWHTNCLAIGDSWVLSVMQRYPSTGDYNGDFAHTTDVCQRVTTLLLNPAAG